VADHYLCIRVESLRWLVELGTLVCAGHRLGKAFSPIPGAHCGRQRERQGLDRA